ncbi:hypothetical protein ACHQM5_018596 [Ranunculus cassubicifolius]
MAMNMSLLVVLMVIMVGCVKCDIEADIKECTPSLIGLSTCLPYVGGTAKTPTSDCCTGMRGVLNTSKKCLCILVKDRNEPKLGFKINATLALNIPSMCKSDATVADCPKLLGLPANSPDAKVFQEFEKTLHNKKPPTSTGNSSAVSTPVATPVAKPTTTGKGNRCIDLKMASQISISLGCFTSLLMIIGV